MPIKGRLLKVGVKKTVYLIKVQLHVFVEFTEGSRFIEFVFMFLKKQIYISCP